MTSAIENKVYLPFCLALLLMYSPTPLAAKGVNNAFINTTASRFRATYESVSLPKNEKMGLFGGTLLFDANNWLSVGGAFYGAVSGNRGGFISLGFATELKKKITTSSEINTGLFIGGGGGRGGRLLSGGGLMLRYHIGAQFTSQTLGNLGVGLSYIDFPNGSIHSLQPYISYDYQFQSLPAPGWIESLRDLRSDKGFLHFSKNEFALVYHTYKIPSGALKDNNKTPQYPTMDLLGAEWNSYMNDNIFLHLETAGAIHGHSEGYMQILLGGGLRFNMFNGTWLKLTTSLGPAGGGGVATGGGLLLDATAALQKRFGSHFYGEVSAGYVTAPEGSFRAISYAAKLGYDFYTPDVKDGISLSELSDLNKNHLRIRASHQTYFSGSPNWRSRDQNLNVDLLGFQTDYFTNKNIFLTGQAFAAYRGKAGAYMIGLVGTGLHLPLFGGPVFVEAEALLGAAGGGSLAVGGGAVWQGNVSIGYKISDRYSLIGSYGYIKALKGDLKAKTLTVSLVYNFTLFTH